MPPTTGPPSFLLVTLDTTRADHIGAYGDGFAITPTLDRLAREGILFEQAIAPTPVTFPSHATLRTGVIPPEHGIRDHKLFRLNPEARLVSEALQRNGWRTGAFVGAFVLDGSYGLDQGFDVYHAPRPVDRPTLEAYTERGADEVVSDAIAWLATLDRELGRDAEARDAMRAAQRIEPHRGYYKIWLENHPVRARPVQTEVP